MQPISTGIFSKLFDVLVEHQPCARDAYTGGDGGRHPDVYQQMDMGIAYVFDAVSFDLAPMRPFPQPNAVIHASLHGISTDRLDQQTAGIYRTGDMYLITTAAVQPNDRILTPDGSVWQIVEQLRTVRMFSPPRGKYLIRRVGCDRK